MSPFSCLGRLDVNRLVRVAPLRVWSSRRAPSIRGVRQRRCGSCWPFHHDIPALAKVLDQALGRNPRHSFIGSMDAFPPLKSQRERQRLLDVIELAGVRGFSSGMAEPSERPRTDQELGSAPDRRSPRAGITLVPRQAGACSFSATSTRSTPTSNTLSLLVIQPGMASVRCHRPAVRQSPSPQAMPRAWQT